jgi:hypothetical protein
MVFMMATWVYFVDEKYIGHYIELLGTSAVIVLVVLAFCWLVVLAFCWLVGFAFDKLTNWSGQ